MRHKLWSPRLLLALTLSPAALASTTWYVDGVHGSDSNTANHASTLAKPSGMPSHSLPREIPSWSPPRPTQRISPSPLA
jgi:hypothetical protein